MNRLGFKDRARILSCLVEGNSMRATCRMTGFAKKTVERALREIGASCDKLLDDRMRNLPCEQIQCDEIWAFVGCKNKNVSAEEMAEGQRGDVWTWVAIDPKTKLIPCHYAGDRSAESAYKLLRNLQPRLAKRVQLTTDGHRAYLIAVETAFAWQDIDYAQLAKVYGNSFGEGRYSPGDFRGAEKHVIKGTPDLAQVSTSHVERQNLTMRMSIRRFTRLTNAFSKCLENHKHALALHFAHYNFCRIHQTIRCTPAMEAGLTYHVWEIEELAALPLPQEAEA
jgi:IS1 family transposase